MPQVNIGATAYRIGASTNPYALQNNGITDIYLGTAPNVNPEQYDRLLDVGGELSWPAETDLYAVVPVGLTGQLTYLNNGASGNPGATRISGPVNISGDVAVSGPVTIAGTVPISGDVGINAPVAIAGTVPISGDVTVSAPVSIAGTVPISGDVTVSAPVSIAGTVPISGDVGITGPVEINGPVAIAGTIPVSVGNAVAISGQVPVVPVAGQPIVVNGAVSITGGVAIAGTVPISGNVGINAPVSIAGTVPISGNVGISGGSIAISAPVNIAGNVNVDGSDINIINRVGTNAGNVPVLLATISLVVGTAASKIANFGPIDVSDYSSIIFEIGFANSIVTPAQTSYFTVSCGFGNTTNSLITNSSHEAEFLMLRTENGYIYHNNMQVPVTATYLNGAFSLDRTATTTGWVPVLRIYGSSEVITAPRYSHAGEGLTGTLAVNGIASISQTTATAQLKFVGSTRGPAMMMLSRDSGSSIAFMTVAAYYQGTSIVIASLNIPAGANFLATQQPLTLPALPISIYISQTAAGNIVGMITQ